MALLSSRSPEGSRGKPLEDLAQAAPGGGCGLIRQGAEGEEPRFRQLPIRQAGPLLLKGANDIEQHMIARGGHAVLVDTEQLRLAEQADVSLFREFHVERFAGALPALDSPTGQMPARHIGVAHQKNPSLAVQHGGAHPHRHATCEAEPTVKKPAQRPLPRGEPHDGRKTPA